MGRSDISKRQFKAITTSRGGDVGQKVMLLNLEYMPNQYGRIHHDKPIYIHPGDAEVSTLEGIILRTFVVFTWDDSGLVQPVYPKEMVLEAVTEWVRRFPTRHGMCPKVEEVIRTEFGFER